MTPNAWILAPALAGFVAYWWLSARAPRLAWTLAMCAFSSALLVLVAGRAHAADLVPETTPDGYAVLLASFPEGAERVCIIREDSPAQLEDACRVPGKSAGRVQVAVWLRKLDPGEVLCAYAVRGEETSTLSEDCWVGVSVPRSKP